MTNKCTRKIFMSDANNNSLQLMLVTKIKFLGYITKNKISRLHY